MQQITIDNILLNVPSEDKYQAIRRVGDLLVKNGYVEEPYVDGMIARENSLSTYIGNGIAIPHALREYSAYVRSSGFVLAQYPEGVDFGDGKTAHLVIGIAGRDDEHLLLLSKIALICQDQENVIRMRTAQRPEEILAILTQEVG